MFSQDELALVIKGEDIGPAYNSQDKLVAGITEVKEDLQQCSKTFDRINKILMKNIWVDKADFAIHKAHVDERLKVDEQRVHRVRALLSNCNEASLASKIEISNAEKQIAEVR